MKPKRKIEPWLFLLPALVVYVSIVLFPMLQTIGYSFMDWNGIGEKTFAGLKNYSRMLSDKNLRTAFLNNMFFLLLGTVFQMFMGLLMATLLSGIKKGSNLFRVLYFIPCININLILYIFKDGWHLLCSEFYNIISSRRKLVIVHPQNCCSK